MFRINSSLWATFLKSKYCKRSHPVSKIPNSSDSHGWKSLMKSRSKAEPKIIWKIQSGNSRIWWDNWIGEGALARIIQGLGKSAKVTVNDFIFNGDWDINKLSIVVPDHLIGKITSVDNGDQNLNDFLVWKVSENGLFSNKTTWHLLECTSRTMIFSAKNVTILSLSNCPF